MGKHTAGKSRPTLGELGGSEEKFPRSGQDSSCLIKVLGVGRLLPVTGTSLERTRTIADHQRARVARRQLLAAGISSSAIGRMVTRGLLRPELAGVYSFGAAASVPLARETAAVLACGEKAVLSHRSAAAVWGIMADEGGPVDITLSSPGTGRRRAGIRLHRCARPLERDVRLHENLPVTSPARTLLDLAGCVDTRALERALDEALVVRRIVRRDQILEVLKRAPNRAGAGVLSRLLKQRANSLITHSHAERRCLELIRLAGLPEPKTQVRIGDYTVDLLWPEHRVVFEIDGFRYHTSRWAFDRDRRKDTAMKAAKCDPNRLSRDQVMSEPYATVATIARSLGRAEGR